MTTRPELPPLPSGVTIRRARTPDCATLACMRVRMFDAMGIAQETTPEAEEMTTAYLLGAVPAGEFIAFLAEEGGEAIGSAAAVIMAGPPFTHAPDGRLARVLNVFVDEHWRGRGIARALIVAVLDECARDGIKAVGLIASEQGRPVYDSIGFEPAAEMRITLDGWLES